MLQQMLTEIVAAANEIGHPKIKTNYYDGFKKAGKFATSKI